MNFIDCYYQFVFILVSLYLGSFAGAMVYRLPREILFNESVIKPYWSHCPNCKMRIPFRYNIPIVSWILLKGISKCCGSKISIMYLSSETAFLTFASILLMSNNNYVELYLLLGLFFVSYTIIVIDCKYLLIPDVLTIGLLAASLFLIYLSGSPRLTYHILGAILGFLIPMTARDIFEHYGYNNALGYGDIKLFAVMGFVVGIYEISFFFVLASIFGISYHFFFYIKDKSINKLHPFGPSIIVTFWVSYVWNLIKW